jgi:hypothetical protein
MAIKVNVGFSRKVGEPNYGSRGASVQLEVELDRTAIDDAERFRWEIERIFERVRDSVDRELQRRLSPPPPHEPPGCCGECSPPRDQDGGHRAQRLATPNQVRAIQTMARHRGVDLCRLFSAGLNGKTTDELTIEEASLLIDQLNSIPVSGSNGRVAPSARDA